MIRFEGVTKYYPTPRGAKVLLRDFSLTLRAGEKVALMGRNGAGKSTMIGMISGTVAPDRGAVTHQGTMSWPMGFSGGFALDVSGRENVMFVSRIYGVDGARLLRFVAEFAELGAFIDMPVRRYSSGMRARLAFGLSMGLGFDWYLVDEITSVGDAAFRKKSLEHFRSRLQDAGLVMVSHSPGTLREYCSSGLVLEAGQATYFEDLEEAIRVHERNMDAALETPEDAGPAQPEALCLEARRLLRHGDPAGAETFVSQALLRHRDDAALHALAGDIARQLGDAEAAIAARRRATQLRSDPEDYLVLGQILDKEGRGEEAMAALREALSIDPDHHAARYALGRALYRAGEIAEAERMLRAVVATGPANAGAHRVLARIADDREDFAASLAHHAEVARLLPDNPSFLMGYARAQEWTGDLAGAAESFRRILSLDPENTEARRRLATAPLADVLPD